MQRHRLLILLINLALSAELVAAGKTLKAIGFTGFAPAEISQVKYCAGYQVKAVKVKVGDRIGKGDQLAAVEPLDGPLDAHEGEIAHNIATLQRNSRILTQEKLLSSREFVESELKYREFLRLKSERDFQRKRCRLESPISGRVTFVGLSVGQRLSDRNGNAAFEVVDDSTVSGVFYSMEEDASKVQIGQKLKLEQGTHSFEAVVERKSGQGSLHQFWIAVMPTNQPINYLDVAKVLVEIQ